MVYILSYLEHSYLHEMIYSFSIFSVSLDTIFILSQNNIQLNNNYLYLRYYNWFASPWSNRIKIQILK